MSQQKKKKELNKDCQSVESFRLQLKRYDKGSYFSPRLSWKATTPTQNSKIRLASDRRLE